MTGQRARVCKSNLFLYAYAELEETTTRSGYNPLMEDFRNTCFFLAESTSFSFSGPSGAAAGGGRQEEEEDGRDRIDQILADVKAGKKIEMMMGRQRE